MFVIDNEIKVCEHGFEEVKKIISRGSDRHLDYLLRVKNALDNLSSNLEIFVDAIGEETNEYTKEQLAPIMPKLSYLFANCNSLLTILKISPVSKELKSSYEKYDDAVELFREFMYDTQEFRLKDDPELDQLCAEINTVLREISNNNKLQG